jgi:hypothetical protein
MAAFRFSCPSCQGLLQGEDALRGKQVRCPTCQHVFPVPAAASANPNAWFVARNKTKEGPYTSAQLKQLATAGQLGPQDMVLREGHGKWLPAASIKGLLPAVATTAITTPPLATLVGPTPRHGSDAPVAIPLNGEMPPPYQPRSQRRRGSWPWLAAAAAGVLVVAGVAMGVLMWSGAFSKKGESSAFDTTYIAADFDSAVIVHPRRMLQSPLLAKALPAEAIDSSIAESGIDPRKVEKVVVLLQPLGLPVGGKSQAALPATRERPVEIRPVQFSPEVVLAQAPAPGSAAPAGRASAAEKAIAWLRVNNAFGPRHRLVEQLATPLREVDGDKAFFLRLGTRLVKSKKPTLLAGKNGSFQAFEVPPEFAGKWIPELVTEFKTTAPLGDQLEPELVTLEKLQIDSASGVDPRRKLTGSVIYRKRGELRGPLGLRVTYMAGEYTYTRSVRLGRPLDEEKGTLEFSFPPLHVDKQTLDGVLPAFVELCAFPEPRKAVVLSNSLPALLHVMKEGTAEEQQAPPGGDNDEVPFNLGTILRFTEAQDMKPIVDKVIGKCEEKEFEGKKYLWNPKKMLNRQPMAAYISDDRTLVIAAEPVLQKMLTARNVSSPLIERLRKADLDNDIIGLMNLEPYLRLPMVAPGLEMATAKAPPNLADLRKLPDMLKAATLTVNLSGERLLEISMETPTPESAASVEKLVRAGVDMAKALYTFGRPMIEQKLPPAAKDTVLKITDQIVAPEGLIIRQAGAQVILTLKRPPNLTPG